MNVIVHGKNVAVTAALKDYVTRKLNKLDKFLDHHPHTAEAVLSVEKTHQIVEVTIPLEGGFILRAEESQPNMYASVDLVVEKLEKQIEKYKTRLKKRTAVAAGAETAAPAEETVPAAGPRLVRRKTFPAKPMSLDEALMQMDLLGHDFFAFWNVETESMNVLYRRRDGQYGLLEPQP
ncbi:Ribosome hibernation promotion factor [Candidatus Hydrogenisulfobacillus filiaventi]|uniref:Ribosome hibernation promoting factor n=1 Tax=Candidatus Hydrogenisulfobacillus filiaventi TaxID=2707344 RepID=A0A6F8ZET3_9FIRM|nr:ribosome-associated translation inhibitor RaiA [Bacillota bacterium]CAB1128153.1 Ribosome hibernation promotion factor [Candidatus Hydrogenisulfobacillus filiaventi]